jgi:hypothetical protein
MSCSRKVIIFIFTLLSLSVGHAQKAIRSIRFITPTLDYRLDTISIIPNSVTLFKGDTLIQNYQINYFTSIVTFNDSNLLNIPLQVNYQVYDSDLSKPLFNKSRSLIEKQQFTSINDFRAPLGSITNPWLDNSSDLSKSGSITRGISIGNRQDVVVNSDLNLQLDGILFDDFKIKAVISDKNIPLQPEGNTQQIQEFDKVFIQIYNQSTNITAGDFDIVTPSSQFMKANKKVLGGQVNYQHQLPDSSSFSTSASFAIAKGKFTRLSITPIEGNQGPYRLTNESGDANIIVIGGSERVFIDGVLLTRGQNNDYIVDYNLGELIFTPKIILSRESKVTVEFEYTDRHYSRSLITNFNQWQSKKTTIGFHVYSEQDMKNQSIQPELTNEQKMILRNAGYQSDLMISPAFDSTSFSSNQVRYKMVDTLVSGVLYDSVFQYSTNPDSAFYALSFTHVGANKGDYILLNNTVNGRVFVWLAPENGIHKGTHSPIYILVPPQKKQMVVGKIDYQISKKSSLSMEIAFSNFDKNTFATIPKQDNYGGAITTQYVNKQKFRTHDSTAFSLFTSKISHQFIAKTFSEIEPSKNSEFFRRFNIQSTQLNAANLNLITADLLFENNKFGVANYTFNYLDYFEQFKGNQHLWNLRFIQKHINVEAIGSQTTGKGLGFNSNYFKNTSIACLKSRYINIGGKIDNEINMAKLIQEDSLMISSLNLSKYELFIQNPDSAKIKFRFWHNYKELKTPFQNSLTNFSNTTEDGASINIISKKHTIEINTIYREVIYSNHTTDKNDFAIIGTITHQSDFLKGAFVINTYYQTSTGREQRREYQYLKVAKGQGQYIWTDFDNDNIEDLDEFTTTPFADQAEYVRIWLLTNDYVKTIVNEYNQTLLINPSTIITKKNLFYKTLSLLKNQTSIFSNNKTTAGPEIGANPFAVNDNQNITSNKSLRNNFYINQSNPLWNIEYVYNSLYNKIFLSSGYENRNAVSNGIILRTTPLKKIAIKIDLSKSGKSTGSELLKNRNYTIDLQHIETTITYLSSSNFRSSISYKYAEKIANNFTEKFPSFFNTGNIDMQLNIPKRGVISSKLSAISIHNHQEGNTPMSIEVLEGLTEGVNLIFNLNLQTVISKNIQLNSSYEMRVSPQKNIVHVGNISIRAFF